jgi:serine/threonine protein kinase
MIGREIGNHRILKELGKGGMGVVYKAHQLSLGRAVAMKVLPRHLTNDAAFIKRFHNEARAIAKLNHPSIVQIYDIGSEDDVHYYTMEFIEGPTLDDVVYKEGFLSPERTIAIIGQVSKALRYAHSQGIVHRDIKPSNIMITKLGRVKVTDFGLALQQRTTRLTVDGGIVGTPEYMSPEQASGRTATAQSDIYSLGVVAYELLTGKVPFEGDSPLIVLNKIQNTEPQWPRAIDPSIPDDLENIVRKMMARNPSDRYLSCQEIIQDTQNIRSGQPVSLQVDRPPAFRRIAVGIAILLVAALGLTFALRRPPPPDDDPNMKQEQPENTPVAGDHANQAKDPGKQPEAGPGENARKKVAIVPALPGGSTPENPPVRKRVELSLRLETPGEIKQAIAGLEEELKALEQKLNWDDQVPVRDDFDATRLKLRLVEARLGEFENKMYPDVLVIKQGNKKSEIRARIRGETLYNVIFQDMNVDRQTIARDSIEIPRYANDEEAREADELLQIEENIGKFKKEMVAVRRVLYPREKEEAVEATEDTYDDTLQKSGNGFAEESGADLADSNDRVNVEGVTLREGDATDEQLEAEPYDWDYDNLDQFTEENGQ